MKRLFPILLLLLFADATTTAQMPYRLGIQLGLMAETDEYRWIGAQDGATSTERHQNGFFGIVMDYTLSDHWQLEFAPRYGQRGQLKSEWDMVAGVGYSFTQEAVDYVAVPIQLRYMPFTSGYVRPYVGGGIEFGLNLSNLGLQLTESRFSDEPPFDRTSQRSLYLHQLFGAALLEAGLDIRASSAFSVLLGVRYTRELTPLLDDSRFTWEAPRSWQVRLALLYTVDI
ncbi:MAG: outer membrane beta-barrel protein [Bacteroidota bacterium]|nr:outer membrane beta-barrel protein [Bacteroidota bacterium]